MQTEKRLIYAEDAKRAIEHYDPAFSYVIDNVPTVEVVHGHWIHDINNLYGCSECMERETMSPKKLKNYCPNCGAQMDGDK